MSTIDINSITDIQLGQYQVWEYVANHLPDEVLAELEKGFPGSEFLLREIAKQRKFAPTTGVTMATKNIHGFYAGDMVTFIGKDHPFIVENSPVYVQATRLSTLDEGNITVAESRNAERCYTVSIDDIKQ